MGTFLEERSFADAQDDKKDVLDDKCHSEHYPCHSERSEESFDKKKTDVLLDIVLKGGNFGVYSEDRAKASRARWSRKLHTFRSFVGNMGFALRYAPGEWFWTAAQLFGGQVR